MIFIPLFLILFLFFYFRLWLHFVPNHRLPVLMYHSVLPKADNDLIVSVEEFEQQLKYLTDNNYQTLFFSDLEGKEKLDKKSVILTFDDAYLDNLEYAYPLLKKYNVKASLMVPTNWLDDTERKTMTATQIKQMSPDIIELGLHSHHHYNYATMTSEQASEDIDQNIDQMKALGLHFYPLLTYPFGKYPKSTSESKRKFFSILKDKSLKYGIRIGNKINYFPFPSPYEVCRLHIKNTDNLLKFRLKLIFGKLKLF